MSTSTPQSAAFVRSQREAREFEFSAQDFERVRKLIYERAGISLSRSQAGHGLQPSCAAPARARAAAILRLSRICCSSATMSRSGRRSPTRSPPTSLRSFAKRITSPSSREHARATIGPAATTSGAAPPRPARSRTPSPLRSPRRSAACNPPVSILASDSIRRCWPRPPRAIYPLERIERLSAERVRRFFLRGTGAQAGHARVRAGAAQRDRASAASICWSGAGRCADPSTRSSAAM